MGTEKKLTISYANPAPSVGEGLIEAFAELAAHLRGEIEVDSYEFVPPKGLTHTWIRKTGGARKG